MIDLFGNEKIQALSWKEPFATLMLHDKIETRTWSTNYRGLVLICASKTPYKYSSVLSISGSEQVMRIQKIMSQYGSDYDLSGKAIAIGRLTDCKPMQWEDQDKCFVQYHDAWTVEGDDGISKTKQLWCHVYEDVRPIKPFAWKGTQGWKTVDQTVKNKIEFI